MMRGRPGGNQKNRWIALVLILVIFCGFFYFYSRNSGTSALEYGSKSLKKQGSSYWGGDEKNEAYSSRKLSDVGDGVVLKSIPVCDDRHSELIPCLDRNLIYQTRLKLDLSLMEHYERHCPQAKKFANIFSI